MRLNDVNDLNELAALLGTDFKSLIYYVYRLSQTHQYATFDIPKKSGGSRRIDAPTSNLKLIQRSIATELEKMRKFNSCVNGFVKGRDIKRNAAFHTGRRFVFNIDLKDYFHSITFPRIYGMLISKPYLLNPKVAACVAKACTLENKLPQGAPSSPVLSNLICGKMDSQLTKLAQQFKCRYSRYADDITFSFNRIPPEAIANPEYDGDTGELLFVEVGHALANIVHLNGFSINAKKTRLISQKGRQEVTGLVVNEKLNVKRRYVRQIRAMLHAWRKFGLKAAQVEFMNKYSLSSKPISFEEVVRGKIEFVRYIKGSSSGVFINLAKNFNNLTTSKPIELELTPAEIANKATLLTESPLYQGTGFLLDKVGFVTCVHCATTDGKKDGELLEELEAWHPDAPTQKFKLSLDRYDRDRDLAVFTVPEELKNVTPLKQSNIDTSDDEIQLWLLGYPNHKMGSPIRREKGQLLRSIVRSGIPYLEVTTKIIEGNSGGPILDENYRVLGIAAEGINSDTAESSAEYFGVQASEITAIK